MYLVICFHKVVLNLYAVEHFRYQRLHVVVGTRFVRTHSRFRLRKHSVVVVVAVAAVVAVAVVVVAAVVVAAVAAVHR